MEAFCLFFYYPAYTADKRSVSLLSLFHSVAALLSLLSYLLFVLCLCSQLFFFFQHLFNNNGSELHFFFLAVVPFFFSPSFIMLQRCGHW